MEFYRSVALARRVDGTASNSFYTLDDVVASRSHLTSGSANGCTAVVAGWLKALPLTIVFAVFLVF